MSLYVQVGHQIIWIGKINRDHLADYGLQLLNV